MSDTNSKKRKLDDGSVVISPEKQNQIRTLFRRHSSLLGSISSHVASAYRLFVDQKSQQSGIECSGEGFLAKLDAVVLDSPLTLEQCRDLDYEIKRAKEFARERFTLCAESGDPALDTLFHGAETEEPKTEPLQQTEAFGQDQEGKDKHQDLPATQSKTPSSSPEFPTSEAAPGDEGKEQGTLSTASGNGSSSEPIVV